MPNIGKVQQNLEQQLPVSIYEGKQAFRTVLDGCGFAKRVVLLFVAVLFSCGFALLNSRVQKIRHELIESKKITLLSKEQVEARKDAAKAAELGKENLVKKEEVKQNPVAIEPQKPIINKPADKLPAPFTPKQDQIQPIKNNLELPKAPLQKPSKTSRYFLGRNNFITVAPHFAKIASNRLEDLKGLSTREDFLKAAEEKTFPIKPVVLAKSEFIFPEMLSHLMADKQPSKLGIKYKPGDHITNMEGALHTFLTPITPITMSGDYIYKGGHGVQSLNGKGRNVVLSAAIHPDFELGGENEVVMKIVGIKENPVEGKKLFAHFPLTNQMSDNAWGESTFEQKLPEYEEELRKHMVYHLTKEHRLPGLNELPPGSVKKPQEALVIIENLIKNNDPINESTLKDYFVALNGHVISLEALFNVYRHQINNEFTTLEALLPQGYVYTINPPSIFAQQIGQENVSLLNRLQLLALKKYHQDLPLENLKIIGFGDFADKGAVGLYQTVFPDKKVCPKDQLFNDGRYYSVKEDYALIIHNNSDAFGNNILTEGEHGSLDGAIGSHSSVAANMFYKTEKGKMLFNEDNANHVVMRCFI